MLGAASKAMCWKASALQSELSAENPAGAEGAHCAGSFQLLLFLRCRATVRLLQHWPSTSCTACRPDACA